MVAVAHEVDHIPAMLASQGLPQLVIGPATSFACQRRWHRELVREASLLPRVCGHSGRRRDCGTMVAGLETSRGMSIKKTTIEQQHVPTGRELFEQTLADVEATYRLPESMVTEPSSKQFQQTLQEVPEHRLVRLDRAWDEFLRSTVPDEATLHDLLAEYYSMLQSAPVLEGTPPKPSCSESNHIVFRTH